MGEKVNLRRIMAASAALRALLVAYGAWQDVHMEVRYTDVDYLVFSDAAALVASGGSPFGRPTYRYSPLLAFLLVPNSVLHPCWGKLLFSAADLLVGYFVHVILKQRGVPEDLRLYSVAAWLFNPFTFTIGTRGNCEPVVCAMVLWIIICIINDGKGLHGSSHSSHQLRTVLPTLRRVTLYGFVVVPSHLRLLERNHGKIHGHLFGGNTFQAAFWYGLVVHFRIYPIIYSLPILLVLNKHTFQHGQGHQLKQWNARKRSTSPQNSSAIMADLPTTCLMFISDPWLHFRSIFTKDRLLFGLFSGSVFLFWTALFFYLYGWEFLNEALLYHLTRTDPRHNFSIYFYHIYLHHQHGFSVLEKFFAFLPQLLVQVILILRFSQDLPFCFFTQTVAFVAFNKVITAQYFVWFFCLLPLILPWSNMKLKWEGLICILVWVGAQVHWLMWGYLLEFKGLNVFVQLWSASIVFLFANVYILVMVIRHHRFTPLFVSSASGDSNNTKKME